jgi:hypothetical protein
VTGGFRPPAGVVIMNRWRHRLAEIDGAVAHAVQKMFKIASLAVILCKLNNARRRQRYSGQRAHIPMATFRATGASAFADFCPGRARKT